MVINIEILQQRLREWDILHIPPLKAQGSMRRRRGTQKEGKSQRRWTTLRKEHFSDTKGRFSYELTETDNMDKTCSSQTKLSYRDEKVDTKSNP